MSDKRYRAGDINENLKDLGYEARMKGNYLEFKGDKGYGDGEKVAVAVKSELNTYSFRDVEEIANVLEERGGLGSRVMREDLTRELKKPVEHSWEKGRSVVTGIFVASLASLGLLMFVDSTPTGAVIGSGSVGGVGLKVVIGLIVVISAFFLFRMIKSKK